MTKNIDDLARSLLKEDPNYNSISPEARLDLIYLMQHIVVCRADDTDQVFYTRARQAADTLRQAGEVGLRCFENAVIIISATPTDRPIYQLSWAARQFMFGDKPIDPEAEAQPILPNLPATPLVSNDLRALLATIQNVSADMMGDRLGALDAIQTACLGFSAPQAFRSRYGHDYKGSQQLRNALHSVPRILTPLLTTDQPEFYQALVSTLRALSELDRPGTTAAMANVLQAAIRSPVQRQNVTPIFNALLAVNQSYALGLYDGYQRRIFENLLPAKLLRAIPIIRNQRSSIAGFGAGGITRTRNRKIEM